MFLRDIIQPMMSILPCHLRIYPRAWAPSLSSLDRAEGPCVLLPGAPAPAAVFLHPAGAAGNFLCPASALSFNAFKTVMDIDTLGTFNTSRVLYEKFFRVSVASTWVTSPLAPHSLRSPMCSRTMEA